MPSRALQWCPYALLLILYIDKIIFAVVKSSSTLIRYECLVFIDDGFNIAKKIIQWS